MKEGGVLSNIIGKTARLLFFALGCYVGLWLLFIKPLCICITAMNTGTLTVALAFWSLLKMLFASGVWVGISYMGVVVDVLIDAIVGGKYGNQNTKMR